MASIQIGAGGVTTTISGWTDESLAEFVVDFHTTASSGKQGMWLDIDPQPDRDPDDEAAGAGLVWMPFASTVTFTFDGEALPTDLADRLGLPPLKGDESGEDEAATSP